MSRYLGLLLASSGVIFSLLFSQTVASEENTRSEIVGSELESQSWLDEINWHGFLSQNFVATDENNYLGSSSNGSFKSNEVGLNASWRASESLQLSVQGIYKQIGNSRPKGGRLDYAILDWRLLDNFSNGVGLRIGRLKNPYGFFNETRDVAATNTSILLPESIYVDYLSQVFHSSDSFGIYAHHEMDQGTFLFNGQFGKPIVTKETISSLVGIKDSDSDLSKDGAAAIRLGYEHGSGLWRAAFSYIYFYGDFKLGPDDSALPLGLSNGKMSTEQYMLSLEMNWNDFQFVTEIQRRNIELDDIYPVDITEKALGYYLQASYKVTPAWTVFLRRDEGFRFKDDRHGNDYAARMKPFNPGVKAHEAFSKDTTLGFRYSPSFEWSFAMEVHQIDGTYWLPNLENPNIADQKRYWNMFLAQVAYRF